MSFLSPNRQRQSSERTKFCCKLEVKAACFFFRNYFSDSTWTICVLHGVNLLRLGRGEHDNVKPRGLQFALRLTVTALILICCCCCGEEIIITIVTHAHTHTHTVNYRKQIPCLEFGLQENFWFNKWETVKGIYHWSGQVRSAPCFHAKTPELLFPSETYGSQYFT